MKHTNRQVKRVAGALLALALAAPIVASAQTLNGTWVEHRTVNGVACTMETIMNSGSYSEKVECGSMMTWQTGTYVLSGNALVRHVTDFEPKWRWIVDGGPLVPYNNYGRYREYQGGLRGHWERNATPPGGTFQVTFTSPNSMSWYDVNFHGTAYFQRVR